MSANAAALGRPKFWAPGDATFAFAGVILTFFGFIHSADGIGVGESPAVAVSYLAVAGILFYCARYAEFHPEAMDLHEAAAEAD